MSHIPDMQIVGLNVDRVRESGGLLDVYVFAGVGWVAGAVAGPGRESPGWVVAAAWIRGELLKRKTGNLDRSMPARCAS